MFTPLNLTVMTTDFCTAQCDHCLVNSSPNRKSKLKNSQIITAIDSIHALGELSVVVFAGGEPTVLGPHLLDAIAHAHDKGISTRLVTNSCWAKTPEKAKSTVLSFKEAGLDEINLSLDDFHEPYIETQNVVNAFKACKNMGFNSVSIATSTSAATKITPEVIADLVGEQLPVAHLKDELVNYNDYRGQDGTVYFISTGTLQCIGRAREKLDDCYFEYKTLDELSGGCHYFANYCALSPNNTILSCCGVEANGNDILDFGSLDKSDAEVIFEAQNGNLIGLAISKIGPANLLKIAHEIDPFCGIKEKYTSVCHACEALTTNKRIIRVLNDAKITVLNKIMSARNG